MASAIAALRCTADTTGQAPQLLRVGLDKEGRELHRDLEVLTHRRLVAGEAETLDDQELGARLQLGQHLSDLPVLALDTENWIPKRMKPVLLSLVAV